MKTIAIKIVAWLTIVGICNFNAIVPAAAFTIGEERELGEKLLFSVQSSFELLDDPDITQYINRLGQSVLEVTGVQYFEYHFFVINDKRFNAFAAPSGLLFFYSGLIGAMQSEDELVSVIAHEIGHIVSRHLAARMETGKYSSIASLGLAVAALAFGGVAAPALLTGALATGQSINLHYSRIHEEEADLRAFDWMKKLGRDPAGQVKMLKSMRRIARYRSDRLPQYLLTHPNPEARLQYIESLIDIESSNNNEQISIADDFDFLRFKYRILSQVNDTTLLKASLVNIIAADRSSELARKMAYYGLSQISKNEKDYKRALEQLQMVSDFIPHKSILLVDRGVIEFEEGRYKEAKSTLETALQQDSSDMYATFTLAKLMYRMGAISEAQSYLHTVSYHIPEYAQVYYELGKIASDKNQNGLSSYYLGKYYLYKGKLKSADVSLEKALKYKDIPVAISADCKILLEKIKKFRK